jgi:hypothetical protein
MTISLTCIVDADMDKITGKARDRIAKAATGAMRQAASDLKTKGRSAMGGMGTKFQNAFRTKVYPQQGNSLKPSLIAYSKIPWAGVFEHGATIAGKPLLWLPLDNGPFGHGGRRMTPAQYKATVGPLILINHQGRRLLCAEVRETDARAKKAVSLRLLKRGRNDGGRGTVRLIPIFVGVASVTDPAKFNLDGVARDVASGIGDAILKNLESSDG